MDSGEEICPTSSVGNLPVAMCVETSGASSADATAMLGMHRDHPVALDDGSAMQLCQPVNGNPSPHSVCLSPLKSPAPAGCIALQSDSGVDVSHEHHRACPGNNEDLLNGHSATAIFPPQGSVMFLVSACGGNSDPVPTEDSVLTFTESLVMPAGNDINGASTGTMLSTTTASGMSDRGQHEIVLDALNGMHTMASTTAPDEEIIVHVGTDSINTDPLLQFTITDREPASLPRVSSESTPATGSSLLTATSSTDGFPGALQTATVSPSAEILVQLKAEETVSHSTVHGVELTPTCCWMVENFEPADSMSLPRCSIFKFYMEFCKQTNIMPINSASFGKLIRRVFPRVTTRRLGTRGQSKYHYNGVAVRKTSPYYAAFNPNSLKQTKGLPKYAKSADEEVVEEEQLAPSPSMLAVESAPSPSAGLAGFPDVSCLRLPDDVPADKVSLFVVLYRAHCQRLLDSTKEKNLVEVEHYISNFWGGLPENLVAILGHEVVIDIIGVCDFLLYKEFLEATVPFPLQQLSLNLTHAIRNFAKNISIWISSAVAQFPESLKRRKQEVVNVFTTQLRRRTSISHLAQATRSVLQNHAGVAQMMADWQQLDLSCVVYQSLLCSSTDRASSSIRHYVDFVTEFEDLLRQQANVESFARWLSTVVDRIFSKSKEGVHGKDLVSELSGDFLMKWQFLTSAIVRDLTLHSAPSFGSFHLLSMLFEDYLLFLLEMKLFEKRENALLERIIVYAVPGCESVVSHLDSGRVVNGHRQTNSLQEVDVHVDSTASLEPLPKSPSHFHSRTISSSEASRTLQDIVMEAEVVVGNTG